MQIHYTRQYIINSVYVEGGGRGYVLLLFVCLISLYILCIVFHIYVHTCTQFLMFIFYVYTWFTLYCISYTDTYALDVSSLMSIHGSSVLYHIFVYMHSCTQFLMFFLYMSIHGKWECTLYCIHVHLMFFLYVYTWKGGFATSCISYI